MRRPNTLVRLVFLLGVSLCLCEYVMGHKECSSTPGMYAQGTFRNELMAMDNVPPHNYTWYDEALNQMAPPDETAFDKLRPSEEFDWRKMYNKIKKKGGNPNFGSEFLNEFSLEDVRIDPNSRHGRAQQTNLEYLLMLDVDRLVWNFRKTAGLPTPGENYTFWEAADHELRGHFVGHYLSAAARMYASTRNETIKQKMTAIVTALSECQQKIGTGYLSAFPTSLFDRVEAVQYVWAPYYTIHKVMNGLLDQHLLAGDTRALKMVTWMADYFFGRIQRVIARYSIDRHWRILNNEYGGMNELYYKLYAITDNPKYFVIGHLFDKPCFLGSLAIKSDEITALHANTHIPIILGAQRRYEITGEQLYRDMATYFVDVVSATRSYATGGTSVREYWIEPNRLADTLIQNNEESCVTHNMLKVSRNLFKWTKEMAYADYYERALTNGVLSIQRGTEPGVMIYFLPLAPGSSKAVSFWGWGGPFSVFWCCYGTGIESFSKLGDSIYFEEKGETPGLYIVQFISSTLNWKNAGISLNMKVQDSVASWDSYFRVNLTVLPDVQNKEKSSTLNLRIPFWTSLNGAKALLNGQATSLPNPGSYLSITRKWGPGDQITLELPIYLRTEYIQDDRPKYAKVQAIFYGNYLLAGLSDGDWDLKAMPKANLSDWITPIPPTYNSHLISLSQQSGNSKKLLSVNNFVGESIEMLNPPLPGTNFSQYSTFRIALKDSAEFSKPKDLIGKSVILEPIHLPGKVISYSGGDMGLVVSDPSSSGTGSVFNLVAGLDGKPGTVSLEAENQKGCFVYAGTGSISDSIPGVKESGIKVPGLKVPSVKVPGLEDSSVMLSCNANSASDTAFKLATSFILESGTSSYDPTSFVAKGLKRNFLLTPLMNLRDEYYTVYFNI